MRKYNRRSIAINRQFTYKEFNGIIKRYWILNRLFKMRLVRIGYRNNLCGKIKISDITIEENRGRKAKRILRLKNYQL